MNHEQLFDAIASKRMQSYYPKGFKRKYATLHAVIMEAMAAAANEAAASEGLMWSAYRIKKSILNQNEIIVKPLNIAHTAGLLKSKLNAGEWCSSRHASPSVEYLNNTNIGIDIIKEVLADHAEYIIREAGTIAEKTDEPVENIIDLDFILFHIQQPLALRKLPKSLEWEAKNHEELFYVSPFTK